MRSVSAKKLLILLSAQMFFYGLYMGGLQLVIADISSGFGKGGEGVGVLVSTQHITAVLMPSLMGILADKVGRKKVLITFSMIFAAGCAVSGFSGGMTVFILGSLLIGGGYSVCESLGCTVMTDLDKEKAGSYINLTQAILCVGAILGPIMMQYAIEQLHASWRLLYMICTGAFLVTGLLLAPLLFPTPASESKKKEGESALHLFRSLTFICLFSAIFMYVGLENGFGYFVDSLFEQKLNNASAGAIAISFYWAGMAICRFICGMKSFDNRRALIICFGASAALFVVFVISKSVVVSLILSAMVGAAYGPTWSLLMTEGSVRFPSHSAAAAGLLSTGCGIAGIIFPSIMGFTSKYAGLNNAFWLLAATAVVGLLFCIKLPGKGASKE